MNSCIALSFILSFLGSFLEVFPSLPSGALGNQEYPSNTFPSAVMRLFRPARGTTFARTSKAKNQVELRRVAEPADLAPWAMVYVWIIPNWVKTVGGDGIHKSRNGPRNLSCEWSYLITSLTRNPPWYCMSQSWVFADPNENEKWMSEHSR